ncbi:MAG: hypothetical protein GY936_12680 [Ignavibacteriae bacterium]|nr:hypothetical protein [Ignavibacteriota bacterium]
MSDFVELFASIKSQMEVLLKEWKEENEWKDGDELEPFFDEYTNMFDSLSYYDISDEELNDSYREGSMWVLKKLDDEYGFDNDELMKTLEKMNDKNVEYARQLIYFVGTEL